MIDKEYNFSVRQIRVKNYLSSLWVSAVVSEVLKVSTALAKVYKLVLKLSRQVQSSHPGDAHCIEFLRHAVIGNIWSQEPLSRVATNQLTF